MMGWTSHTQTQYGTEFALDIYRCSVAESNIDFSFLVQGWSNKETLDIGKDDRFILRLMR